MLVTSCFEFQDEEVRELDFICDEKRLKRRGFVLFDMERERRGVTAIRVLSRPRVKWLVRSHKSWPKL